MFSPDDLPWAAGAFSVSLQFHKTQYTPTIVYYNTARFYDQPHRTPPPLETPKYQEHMKDTTQLNLNWTSYVRRK